MLKQITDSVVEIMATISVVIILTSVLSLVIGFIAGIMIAIINKFPIELAITIGGIIGLIIVISFRGKLLKIIDLIKNTEGKESMMPALYRYKLLKLSEFLFSQKTQKEVFLTEVADWNEEYFEALSNKKIWKARWISICHTYAFFAAMWMKSPIGDLIEFIQKFAK